MAALASGLSSASKIFAITVTPRVEIYGNREERWLPLPATTTRYPPRRARRYALAQLAGVKSNSAAPELQRRAICSYQLELCR